MNLNNELVSENSYRCWLQYAKIKNQTLVDGYLELCSNLIVLDSTDIIKSAVTELKFAFNSMFNNEPKVLNEVSIDKAIIIGTHTNSNFEKVGLEMKAFDKLNDEGYVIQTLNDSVYIIGKTDKGVLYGVHHLLKLIQTGKPLQFLKIVESPKNQFRMINQWDNMDGSIERGYAGKSIFYNDYKLTENLSRIKDYARLLSSVGINAVSINNVNVWDIETNLITSKYLPDVKKIASIFGSYGIQTFLSINYASPIELGNLATADPLNEGVKQWWKEKVKEIYSYIPDFGGFIVKADSENRPGPFSYNRDHAEGANVLAKALQPFNGIVIWRCFVYNCLQDWRDRTTDRAKAAYDNFKPLDGSFLDNVILQVKNGPMDFQVREPVSPLFGAMEKTNQFLEFQVTQEYTGQQKDLCFLVPLWKEVFDYDTYARGKGSTVKSVISGSLYKYDYSGVAAVSNIGNDLNWTGNTLAQANFYGYGRLIWNPDLTSEEIATDWIQLTFGNDPEVVRLTQEMLLDSLQIYENYTAPLGIGWMVNPSHHYGPNIDGYEYDAWGTYHFADRDGIGVDRTIETGTGYSKQYFHPNADKYNVLETCPDELVLFFHHVPYTHKLKSGETVIQHIYDTHFKGVNQVEVLIERWSRLQDKIDEVRFNNVADRMNMQLKNAIEWRDKVNTYFYRKSGISDEQSRTIY